MLGNEKVSKSIMKGLRAKLFEIKALIGRLRDGAGLLLLNKDDRRLVRSIKSDNLTYLSTKKLRSILSSIREIEDIGIEGCIIEAGCALGGSAIVIGSRKSEQRELSIYDVFGMIPSPTEDDPPEVHKRYQEIVDGESAGINGQDYYGYEVDLYSTVQKNLKKYGLHTGKHNIFLIKGLLQDTLHINRSVALVHIDVDWYEPVKVCLERTYPMLSSGGMIILDDYYDWGGCKKATDEFLVDKKEKVRIDDSMGSMKIIKR